jgi:cysteine desulfurase/selenocysteine lyase
MGLCPLPQVLGLGLAAERLQARGIAAVRAHYAPLRERLHDGLARLPGVRVVGPPPGPLACGLLAWRLPEGVPAMALRKRLQDRHHVQVRAVDSQQFNGLRASLHVYNDAAQVDALLAALRVELGAG